MNTTSMIELSRPTYKINKPIRLIELFAGVGSQAMALRNIGAEFEHHKVVEFDKYAIASYNAIHGTDFKTTDITETKGNDLEIIDTDAYCYIVTYSFPCQDLSMAGAMKGMSKDSGTRSGLLWEVERLLNEVDELPQVLLMENVPQVISKKNVKDFHQWQRFLENKGYSNYVNTLNAKNYGVAQNRNRTFMVSILGEWNYKFPGPIPLEKTIKDYLEPEVDEKYYIDNERTNILLNNLKDKEMLSGGINVSKQGKVFDGSTEVASCLLARDYKGLGNQSMTAVAEPKICQKVGDRGTSNYSAKDISNTIPANPMSDRGQLLLEPMIVASRGRNPNNPSDRNKGAEMEQRLEPNSQGICNTLTTVQKDNLVLEKSTNEIQMLEVEQLVRVRKYEVDIEGLITCLREHKEKSKLTNKQISKNLNKPITLVEHWFRRDSSFAIPDEGVWYDLKELLNIKTDKFDKSIMEFEEKEGLYEKGNRYYYEKGIAPTLTTSTNEKIITGNNELQLFTNLSGGKWDKIHESARRVYNEEGIAPTIPTCGGGNIEPKVQTNYRIRKLTPKECWRLMGFTDEDYWKARTALEERFYNGKDKSSSQMYKMAGNSIVVDVLEEIFKNLFKTES